MKIAVVTSNPHKAAEIAAFFGSAATVEHVRMEIPEFRHPDVGEIAREKAEYAYRALGRPVMVDDTAFGVHALRGFPGPYAAYVLDTIGVHGILRLMDGIADRRAWFETAIACATGEEIIVFRGRIDGIIVPPRGTGGFGYDPIFEIDDGRTLAELSLGEKSRVSHRARALAQVKHWLEQQE
ncbi:MAG: RdgB/HAM1 family non-canonical purine NTP pyrophosphatase [Methanomicrobiales archaeon]|nr:RdgB/HAM1 family non-canonical purine NTP pyrophosphatase [Methanomicrobiales archaeon]NYT21185.1 RdgB/HAM1 family non-canonical purine NTP pyrophosphatase [Methanomicrobiales archaeon]